VVAIVVLAATVVLVVVDVTDADAAVEASGSVPARAADHAPARTRPRRRARTGC
jgi:hypothetical protein